MKSVVASLAAVLAAAAIGACGGGGAEPGASQEATLVLDFQPNAAHAGLYAALAGGLFAEGGVELEIREPSASTDAPRLLEAGRADFAVLDIHDLGIARERGLDLVGIAAIVQRPLAAVIAADRSLVRGPGDLRGRDVGVSGLASDDAVLDSVIESAGVEPSSVDRVRIGFDAVPALSAGRLAAATGFWNAEGVALRRAGVPTRELRVDDYGAPLYPELVLTTSARTLTEEPEMITSVVGAVGAGYELARSNPGRALDALLERVDGLDRAEQAAQLDALLEAGAFDPPPGLESAELDRARLRSWARWDVKHGLLERRPDLAEAFVTRRIAG